MKTKTEIETRLLKLNNRYKHDFLTDKTSKYPENCKHNLYYTPNRLNYSHSENDTKLSPRNTNSLVIFQEDEPIRICTYGSVNPDKWNGNICDSDDISSDCPYFSCKHSQEELNIQWEETIKNDEIVLDSYPDIAALQWVLNTRVYSELANDSLSNTSISVFHSIVYYIRGICGKLAKAIGV